MMCEICTSQNIMQSKEAKLQQFHEVLGDLFSFLKHYLPLANAHMTDFIVRDWWNILIPQTVRKDLLTLSEDELALLPSGKLYTLKKTTKCREPESSEEYSSGVVCGDVERVTKVDVTMWDESVLLVWNHQTLKDFITSCQQKLLINTNILTDIHHLLVRRHDEMTIKEFMCLKKQHEVNVMATICAALAKQHDIEVVVDIGSGKGYLSSQLALQYGCRVLGLDSSPTNTDGATGRAEQLGKQWPGLVSRIKKNQFIKEQMSSTQCRHDGTCTCGPDDQLVSNVDGNTSLAVIPKETTKTVHPDPNPDQQSLPLQSVIDGRFMAITHHVNRYTDIHSLLHQYLIESADPVPSLHYLLTGLHTCGDLTATMLRLFVEQSEASVLCNVGCCYHHLSEAFVKCPYEKTGDLGQDEKGFPMSEFLLSRQCQLGRNARMLASQAPDRIAENGKVPGRLLYWRALLQVILCDITGGIGSDWRVGKIAAKCKDFTQYVEKALKKLGFQNKISAIDIEKYEKIYHEYEAYIKCFVQLKAALAPCVEALILLDRVCFLLEQDNIGCVHVVQAFDPVISPRCYAIIASRSLA